VSLGAFLRARLGLFLAGIEGGRRAVEVGPEGLLLLAAFVLLGRGMEWPPRRVDRLVVGEFWEEALVRYGAGRMAVFGVGPVGGVFGAGSGWALVPVFNLVMGLPLKVTCSEVAITLGDAAAPATYLSAGFRLFSFDGGGGRVGGFSGDAGCGVGEGRAAGGFASRRGYAVTCGRLHGGVL
jgi:uncharacterized membrane protein YfcA